MSDFTINIKTVADLQTIEAYRKSLVKLEQEWEKAGKNTVKLSGTIGKLDDALNTDSAIAVKQAKQWADLGEQAQKAGNKIEAARLKSTASNVLQKAGLDPSRALLTEAQLKKVSQQEMARLDSAEKARRAALSKQLKQNQTETAKQVDQATSQASTRSSSGKFTLMGFLQRSIGVGVGQSLGADLARKLARDFKETWETSLSEVANGGKLNPFKEQWSYLVGGLKLGLEQMFPSLAGFRDLENENAAAVKRFNSALRTAKREQALYAEKVDATNKLLHEQLDGLNKVKEASDTVASAKTKAALADIDEQVRRKQLTPAQGEARKSIIQKEAARQKYVGDQAARQAAKELNDKEIKDLSRQELLKLGEVNLAERAQERARIKYETSRATVRRQAEAEQRGPLVALQRIALNKDPYVNREFDDWDKLQINKRVASATDPGNAELYKATTETLVNARKELKDINSQIRAAKAKSSGLNVDIEASRQERSYELQEQGVGQVSNINLKRRAIGETLPTNPKDIFPYVKDMSPEEIKELRAILKEMGPAFKDIVYLFQYFIKASQIMKAQQNNKRGF